VSEQRHAVGAPGLAVLALAGAAFMPAPAVAQSQASLAARIVIDGSAADFTAVETVFRTPDLCVDLGLPFACVGSEEPSDDSAWSDIQDLAQVFVTWDAEDLYVAVEAHIADHALLVFLDYVPGGLADMTALSDWRRALAFGPGMRPDAFVAVTDRERAATLFVVDGEAGVVPMAPEEYRAVATFEAEAPGRGLEIAIPWRLLFPDAASALNPASGAPAEPMFVLPAPAHAELRLAAAVVQAADGFGATDVAPDPSRPPSLDPRARVVVDRAVHVQWDADPPATPRFVDFGAAVQTQAVPRIVPPLPPSPGGDVVLDAVETLDAEYPGAPARLLVADAGRDLEFVLRFRAPEPSAVYVTARVLSAHGERVRDLYHNEARQPAAVSPPFGAFSDPLKDRWDGRDDGGRPVPGGTYVLHVLAGPQADVVTSQQRQAIAVVR
jgi:hypothetical protein